MSASLALLHGWAFGPSVWNDLLPCLPASLHVERWALPGYGAGGAAIVDEDLPPNPPAVCIGWSLGGMRLAMIAAARTPRLRALILVGVNARFLADASWPHAVGPADLQSLQQQLHAAPAVALKKFALLCARGGDGGRSTLRTLLGCLESTPPPAAAVLQSGLDQLRTLDLREAFARIPIPVLLIVGDADPLVPLAAAEAIVALNNNIRLQTIAGAGHAPFLSHPRQFLQAIEPFVS